VLGAAPRVQGKFYPGRHSDTKINRLKACGSQVCMSLRHWSVMWFVEIFPTDHIKYKLVDREKHSIVCSLTEEEHTL